MLRTVTRIESTAAWRVVMSRPLGQPWRIPASPRVNIGTVYSGFHTTSTLLKKKPAKSAKASKGKGREVEEEQSEGSVVEVDFTDLENKFKNTVIQFVQSAREKRQGKASLKVFERLKVHLAHGEVKEFSDVAHAAINGTRMITVTVFDPKHYKYVKAAIVGLNMDYNPQPDKTAPEFIMHITLPTLTSDAKKTIASELKAEFNHFKTSPSRHSLSSICNAVLKKFPKPNQMTDEERKLAADVKKLHKKYNDELEEVYKKNIKDLVG